MGSCIPDYQHISKLQIECDVLLNSKPLNNFSLNKNNIQLFALLKPVNNQVFLYFLYGFSSSSRMSSKEQTIIKQGFLKVINEFSEITTSSDVKEIWEIIYSQVSASENFFTLDPYLKNLYSLFFSSQPAFKTSIIHKSCQLLELEFNDTLPKVEVSNLLELFLYNKENTYASRTKYCQFISVEMINQIVDYLWFNLEEKVGDSKKSMSLSEFQENFIKHFGGNQGNRNPLVYFKPMLEVLTQMNLLDTFFNDLVHIFIIIKETGLIFDINEEKKNKLLKEILYKNVIATALLFVSLLQNCSSTLDPLRVGPQNVVNTNSSKQESQIMTFAEAKARCEGLRNRLTDNPDNIKEYNALCNVLSSKNNYNIQEVNTKKFSYRVDPRKNEERLLGGGLEDTVASIAHKIISSGIELMVHGNESKMNDCRKNGETIEATAVVGGQKYEGNYEGKSKVKLLKKMFLCCCPVYHLVATGEGKFYAKQITYTGIFLDNLFDDNTGKAELCIGNDAKYKGNFEKGKRSGPGILEMYDNKKFCWYKVYEGIWENDIYLDGIGYNPDGSTVQIKKTQTETKTNNSPEKDPLISKTEPQTSDKMIEIHMPNVVKPPAMIDENKNKLVKQNQVVPVNIGTNPTSPKPIRRLSTQDHSNLILKKLENPTLELSLEESIGLLVQCIKNGNIEADKTAGKEAVIFIGNTGAGKSTTVNYLYGCEMQLQSPKELNIKGFEYVITVKPKIAGGKLDELMPIGHTKHSKTFMPQIETDEKNGMTYMDCPGFLDNRGPEINIANAVNIKNAIKKSKSVKVMVLINYHSLKADRGRGLSDMIKITSDLFGKTSNLIANKKSILIGVTNAPTSMNLEGLKKWIVADNLESIKQLSDCIFTFDPLGRETKGGWTREQIIEKINNLKPITNHAKIFSTVLTNEDENKLLDISDKIGSKIIGQLNKSNLIVEDFKQAAKQLSYLEDLSIIDHVTVERLLLRNQNRIERKFQELKNEFNTNCSLENFDSAISLLNLLKESIKFFNSIEQINFEKLEEHLKACNDKKYKAEAKEKIYQEQLKAANNKIEDMIKLLDQQRKDTQSKLDEQQKMFAKMLTEQSESLAKEMKKYDQDRQFIEKEFEARLFKKDEEMAIAKTLNQKEVQGRIEEEKEKLNLEFDNKKKALELEKLKYQQEQKELLAQKQKKQEEENQKLQNRLKELEVAQQKKALEQEKLRLDQEKQEREILLKKQKQEEDLKAQNQSDDEFEDEKTVERKKPIVD